MSKKTNLTNAQKELLANLAKKTISVVESYKVDTGTGKLEKELEELFLNLALARYDLPKPILKNIHCFAKEFLYKLIELKLSAQFSTETILLYSEGPREYDDEEVEWFVNNFCNAVSSAGFEWEETELTEIPNYSEEFAQVAKEYYTYFYFGNEPDEVFEEVVYDLKAYEIIASKAYEFIDKIFEAYLREANT